MTVFHRFNIGNNWGLGHLYRNIVLMKILRERGNSCVAIINRSLIAEEMLKKEGFQFLFVREFETGKELIQTIYNYVLENAIEVYCVFWDRLDSTREYIETVVSSGIKLITFGDYDESIFLATEAINSRETLISGRKLQFSGPSYQLLSKDILNFASKDKQINYKVEQVLLHFGGTDPLNILTFVFNALKEISHIRFIMIDGENQSNYELKVICHDFENIEYYSTVKNFAELIFQSDMCLMAGGVSMFEASAIGTPMINICQNDDQVFAANIFQKKTGSINLGIASNLDKDKIVHSFMNLCKDFTKRKKMSRAMKRYVDARGTERVVSIIENVLRRK